MLQDSDLLVGSSARRSAPMTHAPAALMQLGLKLAVEKIAVSARQAHLVFGAAHQAWWLGTPGNPASALPGRAVFASVDLKRCWAVIHPTAAAARRALLMHALAANGPRALLAGALDFRW